MANKTIHGYFLGTLFSQDAVAIFIICTCRLQPLFANVLVLSLYSMFLRHSCFIGIFFFFKLVKHVIFAAAFGAVLHVISTSFLGIAAITMANTIAGEETVHKLASLLLIVLGGSYILLFLLGKGGHGHSHNHPMEKMAVAGLILVPALSPCATTLPVFLAVGNSKSMMILAIIVLFFR